MDPNSSFDATVLTVWPAKHMMPQTSTIYAYGANVVGWLALIGYVTLRKKWFLRRERIAEASYDKGRTLEEGPAIIHGVVEAPKHETSSVFMAVEIDQQGKQQKGKGKWSHSWHEKARRSEAVPFYVMADQGKRLRVQPNGRFRLIDRVTATDRKAPFWRTRRAELRAGERVFVEGDIYRGADPEAASSAYRQASGSALVMCPPKNGKLLVTTFSLGKRYAEKAHYYRKWAKFLAFVLVFFQFTLWPFHARKLGATTDVATVVNHRSYTVKTKNGTKTHYELTLSPKVGDNLVDEVHYDDFRRIKIRDRVYIQDFRAWPSRRRIGAAPTLNFGYAAAFWSMVVVFAFAIKIFEVWNRPWYERRLTESGTGRLDGEAS